MLVDRVNNINFKGLYVLGTSYNEKEEEIKKDIIDKLHHRYPKDLKNRNYIDYLSEEKGIDIFISKDSQKNNSISVDATGKYTDTYNIGKYNFSDFEPEDVFKANAKQVKECILNLSKLAGMSLITMSLILGGKYIQYKEAQKNTSKEIILKKDSIADSINSIKIIEKIKK